jgi:hypothetical protein
MTVLGAPPGSRMGYGACWAPAGFFGVSSSRTSGPLSIWAVSATWPCWLMPIPPEKEAHR